MSHTNGYEPGGCFIAVMAIAVAGFGLFAPVPPVVTLACGAIAIILFISGFMKGMSG